MFMRKPQHRRFEYTPRYYDPNKDEDERRRRRFRFERPPRRKGHRPFIIIAIMFILVYLLYSYLQ